MNESAHGVRGKKTQKPKDNQDYCDYFKHFASPYAIPANRKYGENCPLTHSLTGAGVRLSRFNRPLAKLGFDPLILLHKN
jgi:hypothetical protein